MRNQLKDNQAVHIHSLGIISIWLVEPGTNRSIVPSRFEETREIAVQSGTSPDQYLAQHEPQLGPLAYADLRGLAEHIRKAISEKYKKT